MPVNGSTAYVYNARTTNLTRYGAHQARGHAALDGFDILPAFAGVLIRDDWHGYHKYSDPARGGVVAHVQLCCAHLMCDFMEMIAKQASVRGVAVGSAAMHRDLAAVVQERGIHPVIERSVAFADLPEAYRSHVTAGVFGKTVIVVDRE